MATYGYVRVSTQRQADPFVGQAANTCLEEDFLGRPKA